ncbi:elastin-like [Panicum virgatum]|uniref:elastin-like n=1 Tax=Panicum virgatum TaxID=38727 RepID=UPI0019D652A9|nr:elastin-like [Panicum virgatum]
MRVVEVCSAITARGAAGVLAGPAPSPAVLAVAAPGVGAAAAVAGASRAITSGASGATTSGIATPGTGASAVAASGVAAPGIGAPAVAASGVASPGAGAPAVAASGAIGLAEAAAPELPASTVAPAVAAEALVAWTPADEPAIVEELLGREALANKEKKPSVKSGAPRIREVNGRTLTLKHRVSSAHGGSATASAAAAPVAAAEAHLGGMGDRFPSSISEKGAYREGRDGHGRGGQAAAVGKGGQG